ncbi:MAG: hypothetical protein NNC24_03450, partial [Candidatus Nanosynbacter sp. P11B_S7_bin.28.1]|nr:hypothetical protein [Candidatus Nanosynbacter sp. P11B_S7_bin.28.1]
MENPQKPTQSLEQKQETPEDYVVATFPVDIDPDNARRPLTVIRSGQDGEGVKYDRGWNPIGMSVVCDTDSEGGIGPIKLLMEAYKLVGTDIKTEFVPLEDIQGLNEDYIKYLYGKTPKEMATEGAEAAKRIWQQKHPDSRRIESLVAKKHPENSSNSSVGEQDGSGFERPSADEASPKIGSAAVKATEIEKPAKIDKVDANPADLAATEPVEKLVEIDKVSADLVDLPAAKSVENPVVEKSMETNETNADILPESFKDAINRFKQLAEENNGKFFAKAQYITGELNQLRQQIQMNPAVIYRLDSEGLLTAESSIIRNLEDSRAEDTNKFKNDVSDLIEELKKKIENDDERSRLVKLTKHVDKMGENNIVLGNVTNDLLDKLIRIRRYIAKSQNDRGGIVHYKSNITQVIGEIINDLSIASGRRRGIVGGIEGIK